MIKEDNFEAKSPGVDTFSAMLHAARQTYAVTKQLDSAEKVFVPFAPGRFRPPFSIISGVLLLSFPFLIP
jgi:hypothetical protein